jgi:hypothetical protein
MTILPKHNHIDAQPHNMTIAIRSMTVRSKLNMPNAEKVNHGQVSAITAGKTQCLKEIKRRLICTGVHTVLQERIIWSSATPKSQQPQSKPQMHLVLLNNLQLKSGRLSKVLLIKLVKIFQPINLMKLSRKSMVASQWELRRLVLISQKAHCQIQQNFPNPLMISSSHKQSSYQTMKMD